MRSFRSTVVISQAAGAILALSLGLHLAAGDAAPSEADLKSAEVFARELEKQVAAGKTQFVDDRFDFEAMCDAVMQGIEAPKEHSDPFRKGLKKNMKLGSMYAGLQAQLGSLRLKKVHVADGKVRALFRMLPGEGINYHDYVLQKQPDATWKIVDMYIYVSGELMSQTLRRSYLPLAAEANKGILERLTTSESEYIKHLSDILKLVDHVKAGRNAEAFKTYQALPKALQEDKSMMIMRLRATMAMEEEYKATLKDFVRLFPGDSALMLIQLDLALNSADFPAFHAQVAALEKQVGPDAALQSMRGNAYIMEQKFAEAQKVGEAAAKLEPNLHMSYDVLLQVAAQGKDNDAILAQLINLKDKGGLDVTNPELIPILKDFCASEQAKKWQALHQK